MVCGIQTVTLGVSAYLWRLVLNTDVGLRAAPERKATVWFFKELRQVSKLRISDICALRHYAVSRCPYGPHVLELLPLHRPSARPKSDWLGFTGIVPAKHSLCCGLR